MSDGNGRSQGRGWAHRLRDPGLWIAVVGLHLIAVLLHYAPDPGVLRDGYLGSVPYGAYQETLWWYGYLGDHLFQPRTWFHTDLQGYPLGVNPYFLYAGDLVAPLLFAPFRALLPLHQATNAFIVAMLVANGVAACGAVRALGGGWVPALLAGLLFACNPYADVQIEHGRLSLLLLFPIPLFVVAWLRCFGDGARRWPIAATLLLALTLLVYPYYGLFTALCAPLLPWVVRGPRTGYLRKLGVLLAGAALLVALPMAPLLADYGEYTAHPDDCQAYAPCARDLPGNFQAVLGHSLWVTDLPQHAASPLLWVALLGLAGPRRVRGLAALALVAWVLALGPYPVGRPAGDRERCLLALPLPYWGLQIAVPGFDGFSHPLRFLALAYALGALAFGGLLQALSGRLGRGWPRRALVLGAVALVGVALARRAPVPVEAPPYSPPALATLGDGQSPLLLLPLQASDFLIYPQIEHRRPMFNSDGLFVPHKTGEELALLWESNGFLRMLRDLDASAAGGGAGGADWFSEAGFQHVVFCRYALRDPWAYGEVADMGWGRTPAQIEERASRVLSAALGPPVYEDADIIAFALPVRGGP